jgi:uncharacterized protein (DUF779 family)
VSDDKSRVNHLSFIVVLIKTQIKHEKAIISVEPCRTDRLSICSGLEQRFREKSKAR